MPLPRVPRSAEVEVVVEAAPEQVWAVLADVPRVGEWSGECAGAGWLDGAGGAVPGARFRGTNRVRWTRWSRVCEVVAVDAPRELVWRTLPRAQYRDSVEWRTTLEPAGAGTRIRHGYRILRMSSFASTLAALTLPEHRERTEELRADLLRLGRVAAGDPRG